VKNQDTSMPFLSQRPSSSQSYPQKLWVSVQALLSFEYAAGSYIIGARLKAMCLLFVYWKSWKESHVVVHHTSRRLAHLAFDPMLHIGGGLDH
jgi:hypothetical protein